MRRIFRSKVLLIGVLAAAVGACVAVAIRACREVSQENGRACLGEKLGSETPEEQIEELAVNISAELDSEADVDEPDRVQEDALT